MNGNLTRWLLGILVSIILALCGAWAYDVTTVLRSNQAALTSLSADMLLVKTRQEDVLLRVRSIEESYRNMRRTQ